LAPNKEKNEMAKPNKNKQNKQKDPNKPKREIVTYKDLFMAYVMGQWPKVKGIVTKTKIGKKTHIQAIEALQKAGNDVTAYEDWVEEEFGSSNAPGRTAPEVGENRDYKVQRLPKKDKDGKKTGEMSGPFIRLPLDSLELPDGVKEQHVSAAFKNGNIVITVSDPD